MEIQNIEEINSRTNINFHGKAGDYFKIWIVNLLLTIVTFGIFSPWAKIRKMKYMSQATEYKGSRMDYHAKPIPILIGRAIAAAIFGLYFWGGQFNWLLGVFGFVLLAFSIPFLFVKSLKFRAKNTSYRNIRFSFRGTIKEAYHIWLKYLGFYFVMGFILLIGVQIFGEIPIENGKISPQAAGKHPLVILQIVVGIFNLIYTVKMLPYILNAIYEFIYNNMYFGNAKVSINTNAESVSEVITGPYFRAIALFFLSLIGFAILIGMAVKLRLLFFIVIPMLFGVYAFIFYMSVIFPYLTNIYIWNRLSIVGFHSKMVLTKYTFIWTTLTNVLGIAISFGLLIPWAQIRFRKMMSEAKSFNIEDVDQFSASTSLSPSPLADEIVDIFDVDFEIGL